MRPWMIYGANGYTGELIAREAARRGMKPILAGRDRDRVAALAGTLGLDGRVFPLTSPDLRGVDAVLHCAGPFSRTSAPMVGACLAAGVHYLDITGEIDVFESIFARDAEARARGIAMIPGVGFDVVPSDCLAAMLAKKLPGADELVLAFSTSRGSSMSRGTLRTSIEGAPKGGAIRRDGRIARVPVASDVMEIPFAGGTRTAMTIPWGDVSTAFHSTGIPNVRVYIASSGKSIRQAQRFGRIATLLRIPGVVKVLEMFVRPGGPSADQRSGGYVDLGGRVTRGSEQVSMTMRTPDGYELTVRAALAAAERLLANPSLRGALTPSLAFGAAFATTIEGVTVQ